MAIERRFTSFNVYSADRKYLDTFFYPGGATLWEATRSERDNYPGATIEGNMNTILPLTSEELDEIAREHSLRRVADRDGNVFYIPDDTPEADSDEDALQLALKDFGIDLHTYGVED